MLNRCTFIGNLGFDPEVKTMQNGKEVANLRLAVTERWKDKASGERKEKTEWVRVTIFNENLVNVAKQYLNKGSKIYIEGQMQTRKWTNKDGQEQYSTEIVLQGFDSRLIMLDGKKQEEPSAHNVAKQNAYIDEELDDSIPF